MNKVYLAGPIDNCTDEEVFGWRKVATKLLGKSNVIDPTRRDYREKVRNNKLTNEEKLELVNLDLEDITEANAVLVNCWKAGWGTPMEIVHAWQRMKDIVCIVKGVPSPWVEYHSDVIVKSVEEGVNWIKKNVFRNN
jgi:hypothetical protein